MPIYLNDFYFNFIIWHRYCFSEIDFNKFGPIEIKPLSRIKKKTAVNLHRSWLNLPIVTHHDEADITELEEFRASLTDINTGE